MSWHRSYLEAYTQKVLQRRPEADGICLVQVLGEKGDLASQVCITDGASGHRKSEQVDKSADPHACIRPQFAASF